MTQTFVNSGKGWAFLNAALNLALGEIVLVFTLSLPGRAVFCFIKGAEFFQGATLEVPSARLRDGLLYRLPEAALRSIARTHHAEPG